MLQLRPRTRLSGAEPARPRPTLWRRNLAPATCFLAVAIVLVAPILGSWSWISTTASASSARSLFASAQVPAPGACSLPQPAFCETFDNPAGIGNRSGQLDGTVWGVSRLTGNQNLSAPADGWAPATLSICGTTRTIAPDNDLFICNGQLQEGQDDNATVTTLAMYPKQPFDFAGRTGKVTFDVSNDSAGNHAAWPEFWISDKPVPAPFAHEATLQSLPQNGLGIRFAGFVDADGKGASCPEGSGYVGVDSAITISNYVENDTFNNGNLRLRGLDCVKQPTAAGQLNHYEIAVSQSQVDIWGTDAGTTAPLKHLATISNTNLSFTRGLIWIEDAHYNGSKFANQGTHSYTWDNVGFDGPSLPRDLTYDVNDALTPSGQTDPNNGLGVLNLGWFVSANATHPFSFSGVISPTNAVGALITFGFYYHGSPPANFAYAVNGHPHTFAWPYPAGANVSPQTLAIPLTLSELVAGTNTITLGSQVNMTLMNLDLVMVGAGGTASSGPDPTQTPVPTVTPIPTSSVPNSGPVGVGVRGVAGCQFQSAPGATAAFCDALSGGPQPGGRAGDLDDATWSVARLVSDGNTSTSLIHFPSTPTSACKAGVGSTSADNDILVCDSASGHQGQFLTALSAQNYGLLSLRPRQPFDFTGRTGTISYNVDALTEGGLSWWTSLFVSDEPTAGANNTEKITGEIPRNGVGVNFDDNCATQATQMKVNFVYVFSNYAETQLPLSNTVCVQTRRGSLNHLEVRLSQTSIEVWASDFSPDNGQTFPNFKRIGQAAINLAFTTGYVHFQQEERAPAKYASEFNISPGYANNYWSNLGFDGPTLPAETGYAVPDALTTNPNGGLNLGYALLSSPNSTYTCCPQQTIAPLSLPNVNLSGVNSAKLTFSVYYTLSDGVHTASTIALQYRLNGGPWDVPNPAPDYTKAFFCGTCPSPPGNANWSVAYSFPVAVSTLVQGINTLEIRTNGTSNGFPPVLANIDLLTSGGSAPSAAAATPVPATPTQLPPTSTATSVPATPTPLAPTPTRTPVPALPSATATQMRTPTATLSPSTFTLVGSANPPTTTRGSTESLGASVTSSLSSNTLVDIEVFTPAGVKVFQQSWDNQTFAAGQTRKYTASWAVPVNAERTVYHVKVATFSTGWGALFSWDDSAAQFSVR